MNADDRVDGRIFLRKIDCLPATLDRRADRYDACYSRFCRATKHVLEIISKIRVIKMRVGFDEHSLIVGRFGETPTWAASAAADALPFHHSSIVLAQVSPPPKTTIRT